MAVTVATKWLYCAVAQQPVVHGGASGQAGLLEGCSFPSSHHQQIRPLGLSSVRQGLQAAACSCGTWALGSLHPTSLRVHLCLSIGRWTCSSAGGCAAWLAGPAWTPGACTAAAHVKAERHCWGGACMLLLQL
jgi:hypothetical protein